MVSRQAKLQVFDMLVKKTLEAKEVSEHAWRNLVTMLKAEFGGEVPSQFNRVFDVEYVPAQVREMALEQVYS